MLNNATKQIMYNVYSTPENTYMWAGVFVCLPFRKVFLFFFCDALVSLRFLSVHDSFNNSIYVQDKIDAL